MSKAMTREEYLNAERNDIYISDKRISEMYLMEIGTALSTGQNIPNDAAQYLLSALDGMNTTGDNETIAWHLLRRFRLEETQQDRKMKATVKHAWRDIKIYLANRYGVDKNSKTCDGWGRVKVNLAPVQGDHGLSAKEIAEYFEHSVVKGEKISVRQVQRILKGYGPKPKS